MGKEHLRAVAVPDLHGMDIDLSIDAEHIDQDLGCIPNPGHRRIGMLTPGEGKVGDGVELVEKGTGYLEEIGQKLIGGPLHDQGREVIEDVIDVRPPLLDDAVYLATEKVKAGARVHLDDGQARLGLKDRGSGGQISNIRSPSLRLWPLSRKAPRRSDSPPGCPPARPHYRPAEAPTGPRLRPRFRYALPPGPSRSYLSFYFLISYFFWGKSNFKVVSEGGLVNKLTPKYRIRQPTTKIHSIVPMPTVFL